MVKCITRYFALPAENVREYSSDLYPDNDTLMISNLKTIKCATLDDGRVIVKAELPQYLIKTMAEQCAEWDIDDPLTPAGVVVLDIVNKYAGETMAEVIYNFPELAGQKQIGVDKDGNLVMVDKMPDIKWACEE